MLKAEAGYESSSELAGNGLGCGGVGTKVIRIPLTCCWGHRKISMTWCWGHRRIRSYMRQLGKVSCMPGMADAGLTESPHGTLPALDLF